MSRRSNGKIERERKRGGAVSVVRLVFYPLFRFLFSLPVMAVIMKNSLLQTFRLILVAVCISSLRLYHCAQLMHLYRDIVYVNVYVFGWNHLFIEYMDVPVFYMESQGLYKPFYLAFRESYLFLSFTHV